MALSEILDNEDPRFVSFPVGANVFKFPGGGQNYVHGGSSPQEMLVPVIDVRTEKAFVGYTNAQIALVSMLRKVTNLIVPLDFIQSEPVSDTVKAATYRLFFINDSCQFCSQIKRINSQITSTKVGIREIIVSLKQCLFNVCFSEDS